MSSSNLTSWPVSVREFVGRRAAGVALAIVVGIIAFALPARAHAASALARTTSALTGLKDASQLTAQNVCAPANATEATCFAQVLVSSSSHALVHPRLARLGYRARIAARRAVAPPMPGGGPEPQPGSPAYLQQAYDLSYLSQNRGSGDTVAIVDAYNNPAAEADLAAYRLHFGLPACTTQNGCFRKVDQNGGQNFPGSGVGWTSEISLDLDAASALCPNCHIVLVEANSAATTDLVIAQATAAALGANQISDSFGAPSTFMPSGQYTFPGVATVAASGDSGYQGLIQSQYPAALPNVTAAGGTSLIPASTSGIQDARGFAEQAWSGSGSGCNLAVPKPAWQSDPGCSGRAYSDLSADGNAATGLDVYDSSNGGWVLMGGTSASTPLIAAYYAITGASAATPAWVYQHSSLLNDPTGQSNGNCMPTMAYICAAGTGYDGPTGAGSISGAAVPGAPGIGGPGPGGEYTQGVSATSAALQAGIYPNGSETTYAWQYGTTTDYGQSTAPSQIGSGQAVVSITSTLAGLTPGATYHYRLAAQNAFGTAYGYDFMFTTGTPSAPTVSPVRAAATGRRTAKLSATIDGQGGGARYRFIYRTGHNHDHSTATAPLTGVGSTPVSATITGLSPHTTYRVKLVASNAGGSTHSATQTFTTPRSLPQRRHRHLPRHSARHR